MRIFGNAWISFLSCLTKSTDDIADISNSFLAFFIEPSDVIFPAALWEALVGAESVELFRREPARLAVEQREVRELTQLCEADRPLHRLLDRLADDRVAVRAEQYGRAFPQRVGERVAALDGAHEACGLVERQPVGGEKLPVMVQRLELHRQHA